MGLENRLVVAMGGDQEWDTEGEEGGYGSNRVNGEILVQMELFCVLTVSSSLS